MVKQEIYYDGWDIENDLVKRGYYTFNRNLLIEIMIEERFTLNFNSDLRYKSSENFRIRVQKLNESGRTEYTYTSAMKFFDKLYDLVKEEKTV